MRDWALVAAALLWAGAMYAVYREGVAEVVATDAPAGGVFSEDFEPYLAFRFRVKGFPVEGRGERRTRDPYEGRRVVTHSGSARAEVFGRDVEIEFSFADRWDVKSGFVMAEVSVSLALPGVPPLQVSGTAYRSGDFLVMEMGGNRRVVRFPQGTISAGFLEPAPVGMAVGATWTERAVVPAELSGGVRVVPVEVEVVGRDGEAFDAVARMEAATGRMKEYRRRYDAAGRCLRQEMPLGGVVFELEREHVAP